MNSPDPWRVMQSSPPAERMIVPAPYYGHAFFGPYTHGRTFVGEWVDIVGAVARSVARVPGPVIGPGYSGYGGWAGARATGTASMGESRQLFSGAEARDSTSGITARLDLDHRQCLHATICIDGKCYTSSMNLAPAIAAVMAKFAQYHTDLHKTMPTQAPAISGDVVVCAIDRAVAAAGDALIGELIARHVEIGGWLDDIGHAIGGVLRDLKPVISAAATQVATYYGGPAAGAAAGQLAPMVTDLHANALDKKDPKKAEAAKQAIGRVNQVAKTDPRAAQALNAATKAVANTAIAYYANQTAKKAAAGDPAAKQDLNKIVVEAEKGDPAAQSTTDVISATFAQELIDRVQRSEWGARLWERATGRGPATVSGWDTIVGKGFWDDVKDVVLTVTLMKPTNQFIHDNHLEPYVHAAGAALATIYGGPAAAAAAGAISPYILSLGVEDKKKADAAKKTIQGVKAKAQERSPQMAQAANVAQVAVEQAATAYQVAQVVKDAKAGKPEAQQSLVNLQAATVRGDQKAAKALQAAAMIDREQRRTPGGAFVSGWHEIVGVVIGANMLGAEPYYEWVM